MNKPSIKTETVINCPKCGKSKKETMPTDACQYFWECPHCNEISRPKTGDCCVFCSYADTPCPPVQQSKECC